MKNHLSIRKQALALKISSLHDTAVGCSGTNCSPIAPNQHPRITRRAYAYQHVFIQLLRVPSQVLLVMITTEKLAAGQELRDATLMILSGVVRGVRGIENECCDRGPWFCNQLPQPALRWANSLKLINSMYIIANYEYIATLHNISAGNLININLKGIMIMTKIISFHKLQDRCAGRG